MVAEVLAELLHAGANGLRLVPGPLSRSGAEGKQSPSRPILASSRRPPTLRSISLLITTAAHASTMPLTSSRADGRFRASRASEQSEYTLFPSSACPRNQDRVRWTRPAPNNLHALLQGAQVNQQLSLIQYPLKLQPVCGNQPLAHATGLLCYPSSRTTLVTNWHVVSGKDAFTGKHLNKCCLMPTSLRVSVALCEVERHLLEKTPTGSKETVRRTPLLRRCHIDVPLYEDGTPRWKEHPTLGAICDVVALDIDSEYRALRKRLNPQGYHTVPGTTCEPFSTWVDRRDDMKRLFSNTESFDLDSDVVVVGFPHLPVSPPTVVSHDEARGGCIAPFGGTVLQWHETTCFLYGHSDATRVFRISRILEVYRCTV